MGLSRRGEEPEKSVILIGVNYGRHLILGRIMRTPRLEMNATFLAEFYRPNPESQKVQPPATSRYISPIGYGYLYLP